MVEGFQGIIDDDDGLLLADELAAERIFERLAPSGRLHVLKLLRDGINRTDRAIELAKAVDDAAKSLTKPERIRVDLDREF